MTGSDDYIEPEDIDDVEIICVQNDSVQYVHFLCYLCYVRFSSTALD